MKGLYGSLTAIVFALFLVFPAFAGEEHCRPGDPPPVNHRCYPAGSPRPNVASTTHSRRQHYSHQSVARQTASLGQPSQAHKGPTAEDLRVYRTFRARADQQAQKRAAIHEVPVQAQCSGGPEGVGHCHIDAMFTERGAI